MLFIILFFNVFCAFIGGYSIIYSLAYYKDRYIKNEKKLNKQLFFIGYGVLFIALYSFYIVAIA